jgi:hypothetical protein
LGQKIAKPETMHHLPLGSFRPDPRFHWPRIRVPYTPFPGPVDGLTY